MRMAARRPTHEPRAWEQPSTGPAAALAAKLQARLPVLETARLTLRAPPRIEDFDAYAAILMSERAVHMGGPFDRREAWLDFTQVIATWHLRGHGLWTVTRKTDSTILGFVLIGMEQGDQEPELGYFFLEEAEGKGYAAEAAEAARDHARTLELPALVSYIDPPNTRSRNLAERVGGASRDTGAEGILDDKVLVLRHWGGPDTDGNTDREDGQ